LFFFWEFWKINFAFSGLISEVIQALVLNITARKKAFNGGKERELHYSKRLSWYIHQLFSEF